MAKSHLPLPPKEHTELVLLGEETVTTTTGAKLPTAIGLFTDALLTKKSAALTEPNSRTGLVLKPEVPEFRKLTKHVEVTTVPFTLTVPVSVLCAETLE